MRLVLVLLLAAAAAAAVSVFADRRRMKNHARALGLDSPGVRVVDCPGPMLRFAVKPEEGTAWVVNDIKGSPTCIPLEDIAGCEFLEGGSRSAGLAGMLVGEAAAGALRGQAGGSVLRILRKDPDLPAVEYRLRKPTYQEDFRMFAGEVAKLIGEYAQRE